MWTGGGARPPSRLSHHEKRKVKLCCVLVRAKPGRATSPLASGSRNAPLHVVGCADAIRPETGENLPPHISGAVLRHDGLRRAGTARPTHPCTREIASFSPDNSIGFPSTNGRAGRPSPQYRLFRLPVRGHGLYGRGRSIGKIGVSLRSPRNGSEQPALPGAVAEGIGPIGVPLFLSRHFGCGFREAS